MRRPGVEPHHFAPTPATRSWLPRMQRIQRQRPRRRQPASTHGLRRRDQTEEAAANRRAFLYESRWPPPCGQAAVPGSKVPVRSTRRVRSGRWDTIRGPVDPGDRWWHARRRWDDQALRHHDSPGEFWPPRRRHGLPATRSNPALQRTRWRSSAPRRRPPRQRASKCTFQFTSANREMRSFTRSSARVRWACSSSPGPVVDRHPARTLEA